MKKMTNIMKDLEQWMQNAKIPGAAVVIIKDGKVLLCESLGYSNIEANCPVTGHTKFLIGSLTKAFTALSCMLMKQSGRIDPDEAIRNYIPEFTLGENNKAKTYTLRDFLLHRSGLPAHDGLWLYHLSISRSELFHRLCCLEPAYERCQRWQYNNLGYMLAGYTVEKLTDNTWEDYMKQAVFPILEINGEFCLKPDFNHQYASPYRLIDGKMELIPHRSSSAMSPAGTTLWCDSKDMASWIRYNLGDGTVNGVRLLDERCFRDMRSPQISIPYTPNLYSKHRAYCLGWFYEQYQGYTHLFHDGSYAGYSSFISLFPEKSLGIAILTNVTSSFVEVAALALAEEMLGLRKLYWNNRLLAGELESYYPRDKRTNDNLSGGSFHTFFDYSGKYLNTSYGILNIYEETNQLYIKYYDSSFELKYQRKDTFIAALRITPNQTSNLGTVKFERNSNNSVQSVSIPFEPTINPIKFIKQ